LKLDPKSYRYTSRSPAQAAFEGKIKIISPTRVRCGYRRVHILLRRERGMINWKETRRIYRKLGLQLRKRTPKRCVKAKLQYERKAARRVHEAWAMDFVHDQAGDGIEAAHPHRG
jgi:putative transposase